MMSKEGRRRLNWFLTEQVGINLLRILKFPAGLVRYLKDYQTFRRKIAGQVPENVFLWPCMHDWYDQAGATKNEYFWQDLFVAKMIHDAAPVKHVDVGSRLDGFVAHLASFREVEVFDIRPLKAAIPGVTFRQADMMKTESILEDYADSVSCLHAIEHFGLGRYGDPIDVFGSQRGLASLARMVKPGGILYLSCPFGKNAVYFNAHRTIDPMTMTHWAAEYGLRRKSLYIFDSVNQVFVQPINDDGMNKMTDVKDFTLAFYIFEKTGLPIK